MNKTSFASCVLPAAALAALLSSCGGSTGEGGAGTLRLSLTDAPACGFDHAYVTVEKVRVHKSPTAPDSDGEWQELVLPTPQRVDLLTLTNGTLQPLGQKQLPAGTYTQMRLVLAENSAANPLANAVTLAGAKNETALTTPSGQQSGLKMNVNIEVPEDKIADFAIDFDACKSFVRAGNSGKILLKPVLAVIPILSDAGQRIEGWVHPSLVGPDTQVSAQTGGRPARGTSPAADGRFVLYPIPAGSYELVITAAGRVNAAITGVPVTTTAYTTIGSATAPINTPVSVAPPAGGASAPAGPASAAVSGTVTANGSPANTGGVVRATQSFSGGPTIEVGSANADSTTGAYSITLPTGAPAKLAYAAGATTFNFTTFGTAGSYKLEATATGFATPKMVDITLTGPLTQDFVFVP